jgi:hypothetical protein
MKAEKEQTEVVPDTVSREEFTRILGKLASAAPEKRKDARTGEKKTQGKIIPARPDSDQR